MKVFEMRAFTWVITGLLDSGKTTLINRLLKEELSDTNVLVLQFEEGEEPLIQADNVRKLVFSKKELEKEPFSVAGKVILYLEKQPADLMLIEWNGIEHFHTLEEMFLSSPAQMVVTVERVIYVADGGHMESRIMDAGLPTFSQIAGSDCAYIRTKSRHSRSERKEFLHSCNPGIKVYTSHDWKHFRREFFAVKFYPVHWLLIMITFVLFYMVFCLLMYETGINLGRWAGIFLGVFLQAVPFLAIGVLLSSLIQIYVPADWIQRHFPQKTFAGQIFAIVAGFCLPVCDCASIPVFKSLVKKGVPVSAAVTFMLVSPVINPVVILSTYYAFNGNYKMIAARCGLGILCAVICGLTYAIKPSKNPLLEQKMPPSVLCDDYTFWLQLDVRISRIEQLIRHAQNEFFSVGKFLIVGILVSSCFQNLFQTTMAAGKDVRPCVALLMMMCLAFVLSLCSSSDAVVARSMAGSFPVGAILGFLVFGPMMDIKNVAMLLSGFKSRFVLRLLLTVFVVCFTVIMLFVFFENGGIRI